MPKEEEWREIKPDTQSPKPEKKKKGPKKSSQKSKVADFQALGELAHEDWEKHSDTVLKGARRHEKLLNITRRFRRRSQIQEELMSEDIRSKVEDSLYNRKYGNPINRLRRAMTEAQKEEEQVEETLGYLLGGSLVTALFGGAVYLGKTL